MDTRFLGCVDCLKTYESMQRYTEQRHAEKSSENIIKNSVQPAYLFHDVLLIYEHNLVFTHGLDAKSALPVAPGSVFIEDWRARLRTCAALAASPAKCTPRHGFCQMPG